MKLLKKRKWYIKAMIAYVITLFAGVLVFLTIAVVKRDTGYADILAVILNTIVAVLGFLAIWANIQNDKEIKRYEFVADYNHNFLTNKEFITVERMLESCNQKYENIKKHYKDKWDSSQDDKFREYCDRVFGTKDYAYSDEPGDSNSRIDRNGWIKEEYQQIVNYLVYLESFVPLLNGQLNISDVDDLYGYRYFIAMNNPVLQENELFRESIYYRGCIGIYERWRDYREKNWRICCSNV